MNWKIRWYVHTRWEKKSIYTKLCTKNNAHIPTKRSVIDRCYARNSWFETENRKYRTATAGMYQPRATLHNNHPMPFVHTISQTMRRMGRIESEKKIEKKDTQIYTKTRSVRVTHDNTLKAAKTTIFELNRFGVSMNMYICVYEWSVYSIYEHKLTLTAYSKHHYPLDSSKTYNNNHPLRALNDSSKNLSLMLYLLYLHKEYTKLSMNQANSMCWCACLCLCAFEIGDLIANGYE